VAHPALVPVALKAFDKHMPQPNQISKLREDVNVTAADLLAVPKGTITEDGVRGNLRVGIQYLEAWLGGLGCVPLYNLMEDAATAEISRSQIWQWLHYNAPLADGRKFDNALYDQLLAEELVRIEKEIGSERFKNGHFDRAVKIFTQISKSPQLEDFLTLPAYREID